MMGHNEVTAGYMQICYDRILVWADGFAGSGLAGKNRCLVDNPG